MTITMTIRWLSYDYPMTIQWLPNDYHDVFLIIIDLKRSIDQRWLFKSGATFILRWSCLSVSQQQIQSWWPTAWKINWPGVILEKVECNKTRQEKHKKSSEIPSRLVLLIWFVIYTWHWAWGEASTRWLSAQTAVVTTATTYSNATAEIVHSDHTEMYITETNTYI